MITLAEKFCCLNADEQAALRQSGIAAAASLGTAIPFSVWDAFWLPLISSRETRQEVFIACYDLTHAEGEFGDPAVPTDLIIFGTSGFWLAMAVFVFLPDAACLDGCEFCVPYPCP